MEECLSRNRLFKNYLAGFREAFQLTRVFPTEHLKSIQI